MNPKTQIPGDKEGSARVTNILRLLICGAQSPNGVIHLLSTMNHPNLHFE